MNEIIITPLGTVSPYPKGNMNCPGFMIEKDNNRLLLDCGNGSTRLLKFPEVLNNLDVIITHYHKDHIGDLGSIQYSSFVYHNLGLLNNKINIHIPENEFNYNKSSILSNKESYSHYYEIYDGYTFNKDDLNIAFYDNNSHTIETYVVKIQNKDFKIIYTSDIGTTNFDKLIEYSKDSDLIICESSFLKKHNSNSTTHMRAYDAGILAKESNSKKLLLTHFWPEEDKELYLEEAKEVFENTELAIEGKKLILKK